MDVAGGALGDVGVFKDGEADGALRHEFGGFVRLFFVGVFHQFEREADDDVQAQIAEVVLRVEAFFVGAAFGDDGLRVFFERADDFVRLFFGEMLADGAVYLPMVDAGRVGNVNVE